MVVLPFRTRGMACLSFSRICLLLLLEHLHDLFGGKIVQLNPLPLFDNHHFVFALLTGFFLLWWMQKIVDNLGNVTCSLDPSANGCNLSQVRSNEMDEEKGWSNEILRLLQFRGHAFYLLKPFCNVPDFLLRDIGWDLNEKSRLLIVHTCRLLSNPKRESLPYIRRANSICPTNLSTVLSGEGFLNQ